MMARAIGFSALLILLSAMPAAQARSQPAYPAYFESLGPDTYLPGAHVVLTVANPPAPEVRIYALPLERAIAQLRDTSGRGASANA